MTIEDVLRNCSDGKMPEVKCFIPINGSTSDIGQITVIKMDTAHSGYRGVGVKFPPLNYDIWFYEENGTDKRKKYMNSLSFINVECPPEQKGGDR